MKIRYKVTGAFGMLSDGEIVTAHLLNLDEDSGIGLCFHPWDKDGCGSFEFVKQEKNLWISAFSEDTYSNVGKLDKNFRKFLNERTTRTSRKNRRNRTSSKRR